ncbi:MAG TPA: DUF2723 domain-containing protein [Candidatus Binatia bacterium]|nr:DUF2723 domain-containing protein [Candidatus Binatia bacterium]
MRFSRTEQGCLAAAAAAVLYALTLSRGVGAGDSGELILAAQGLGIAHPPGYPLWVLLARLAAAIPAGGLALRVNALSAASTALSVGLFWMLARRAGLRAPAAAVATALLATASIVWSSAVEAEVYGLALLAFLALALLAFRARRARASGRDEALYFFAAGLATIVHQTLLFPALAGSAWVLARRGWSAPRLARGLAWAAAGASITWVLPVRWSAGPPFAWTDVRGIGGLADYLLRRTYGGLAQNPFRLDRAVDQGLGMAALSLGSLGLFGSVLAGSGVLLGYRARRPAVVVGPVLVAAMTVPAALMALIRFTPDPEHLAQVAPFLAPVVAAGALLAGTGAQRLGDLLARRRTGRRVRMAAALAPVLVVAALLPGRFAAADRSRWTLPERYGRDLLAAAPARATLVLDGDNETFLAAYASRSGTRPDVALTHRRGWIFGDPNRLRSLPRSRWTVAAHGAEIEAIRRNRTPVCYPIPPGDLIASGVRFRQRGLLYEACGVPGASGHDLPQDGTPAWVLPADWPRSSDLLGGHPERYDYVTRKMAISYSDAAARWLWSRGRIAEALPWFLDAARVGFDIPGARLNASAALAASGEPERALDELLAACRLAPYDPEPRARLAVFLAAAGRPGEAALWFERAFRVEPSAALAADASRAWMLAGDGSRARQWGLRAGGLAPAPSRVPALAGGEG